MTKIQADRAIAHLNADHADALLDMARALGGCPEATAARCLDADTTGLTLLATTPAGERRAPRPLRRADRGRRGPPQGDRETRHARPRGALLDVR